MSTPININRPELDPVKCVWMAAGVVDYKLCDRPFECEQCVFDRAMRARRNDSSAPDGALEPRAKDSLQIVETLFYDQGHQWVRIEEAGKVRIGLDDFARRLVGRVYAVRLPEPGTRVVRGEPCWTILHQAGETTLPSPVDGVVEERNERLLESPSLVSREPYGEGWTLVIEPDALVASLAHLLSGRRARSWCAAEVDRLVQEQAKVASDGSASSLGVTLADGGAPLIDPAWACSDAGRAQRIIHSFLSARTPPRGAEG